jgi:hypothetical protein
MLQLSKDGNDSESKRKLHKKIDAAKTIGMLSDDKRLYYYAYVRQGKVNGEEVQPERREFWGWNFFLMDVPLYPCRFYWEMKKIKIQIASSIFGSV